MGDYTFKSPHVILSYAVLLLGLINFIIPVSIKGGFGYLSQADLELVASIFSIVSAVAIIVYSLNERASVAFVKWIALGLMFIAVGFYIISFGMFTFDSTHDSMDGHGVPYGAAATFCFFGFVVGCCTGLLFFKETNDNVGDTSPIV